MALVIHTVRPRRPKANDGEPSATGTSSWGVLACSASTGGQIRLESEELLGKKVLESQCSPEVFDTNTRSELLQALVDSANASRDASGTAENTGQGLGAGPASVQVHTMGENLAVIAPVNYVLGGTPSYDLAERCQRLLDTAVGGSGAASSLEQVAVDKVREAAARFMCWPRPLSRAVLGLPFSLHTCCPALRPLLIRLGRSPDTTASSTVAALPCRPSSLT